MYLATYPILLKPHFRYVHWSQLPPEVVDMVMDRLRNKKQVRNIQFMSLAMHRYIMFSGDRWFKGTLGVQ